MIEVGQAEGRLRRRLDDSRPVGGVCLARCERQRSRSGLLGGRRAREGVLPDEDELRGRLHADAARAGRGLLGALLDEGEPAGRGRCGGLPAADARAARPDLVDGRGGVDSLLDERELADPLLEGARLRPTPSWVIHWSTATVPPAAACPIALCEPAPVSECVVLGGRRLRVAGLRDIDLLAAPLVAGRVVARHEDLRRLLRHRRRPRRRWRRSRRCSTGGGGRSPTRTTRRPSGWRSRRPRRSA